MGQNNNPLKPAKSLPQSAQFEMVAQQTHDKCTCQIVWVICTCPARYLPTLASGQILSFNPAEISDK